MTVDPWTVAFVAHLLAAHIAVPEPVTIRYMPQLEGFSEFEYAYIAQIERQYGGSWVIYIQRERWDRLSKYNKQWVLAHELCHAVHTYDVRWDMLDKPTKARLHKVVDRCANTAMSQHLIGVNHR